MLCKRELFAMSAGCTDIKVGGWLDMGTVSKAVLLHMFAGKEFEKMFPLHVRMRGQGLHA